ncbi:hypothetical protein CB0940_10006 [Cercospora beticola]|uniref:BTB domain-containing protein n=2 Tax=Cercospora beticola TaxID=122368 RepID=A0A2G5HGW4_CERBT|nr:hypothetical protein CB0940_10006 [Cercospora beticola]PIA91780.1 hypothetical protein CB0940_10006 [Cercospora beticola]
MSRAMAASLVLPDSKYSDMTILCENHSWDVHAVIVCPQSGVLEEAWDSDHTAFYSKQNPEVLQAAIEFFYSEDYREATGGKAATSTCSVVFHARVYDVAEYLQAPSLMIMAAGKFQKACEDLWASDGFALLAKAIYCGTELDGRLFKNDHDELHIRFLTVAKAHAADLFRFQAVGREFRDTLRRIPALHTLSFELAEALASQLRLADKRCAAIGLAEAEAELVMTDVS